MNMVLDPSQSNCKGCSATVHVSQEELTQLAGANLHLKEAKLTTEMNYSLRMSSCTTCDAFQFGTTCRWNGSLMALKAKLADTSCPHPEGSKW